MKFDALYTKLIFRSRQILKHCSGHRFSIA
jgi:hypothetical protein